MRLATTRRGRLTVHSHAGGALTLTSMMDILTVLLIFVLQSTISGGEVAIPPPGLELPKSTVERPTESSLVVAIDHRAIMVGGEAVASVGEAAAAGSLMIEPLAARLREARAQQDELARRKGQTAATTGRITIQGDRDVEFRVLQKVMFTVNQSGFPDIALAVLKKS